MFFLSTYIVSKSYLLHCLHQLICSVPAFLLLRQHLTFTICSHYLQDILVFVNIFIQLTLSTSNHLSCITYLSDSKPQLQRLDNSPNSPGYQEIQPNTAGLNTQGKEVKFFFFFFFLLLARSHGLQTLSFLTRVSPWVLAVKALSPNHQTTREFPEHAFLMGEKRLRSH